MCLSVLLDLLQIYTQHAKMMCRDRKLDESIHRYALILSNENGWPLRRFCNRMRRPNATLNKSM